MGETVINLLVAIAVIDEFRKLAAVDRVILQVFTNVESYNLGREPLYKLFDMENT